MGTELQQSKANPWLPHNQLLTAKCYCSAVNSTLSYGPGIWIRKSEIRVQFKGFICSCVAYQIFLLFDLEKWGFKCTYRRFSRYTSMHYIYDWCRIVVAVNSPMQGDARQCSNVFGTSDSKYDIRQSLWDEWHNVSHCRSNWWAFLLVWWGGSPWGEKSQNVKLMSVILT